MLLFRENNFSLGLGARGRGGFRFTTPSWRGSRQGSSRKGSRGSGKYFPRRDRSNSIFSERSFTKDRAAVGHRAVLGSDRNRGNGSDFGGDRSGDEEFSSKRFERDFSKFRGRLRRGGHMRS